MTAWFEMSLNPEEGAKLPTAAAPAVHQVQALWGESFLSQQVKHIIFDKFAANKAFTLSFRWITCQNKLDSVDFILGSKRSESHLAGNQVRLNILYETLT